MRLSMGSVTRSAAGLGVRIGVRFTRNRWRRPTRRPVAVTPVVLTVLASLALVSVTASRPEDRPGTEPAASAAGAAGPPRLAFTSEHLSTLAVRQSIFEGGAVVGSRIERLFGPFFHDVEPSSVGGRLAWVGYRTDPDPYQS